MFLLCATQNSKMVKTRGSAWALRQRDGCRLARIAIHPCVDQSVGQADHVAQARSILQARQRRLGTQIATGVRQPSAGQLECRIGPQMIEVVGVLVAAADREHAIAEHIDKAVHNPRRIAPIRETPGPDCRPNRDAARPPPEASRPRSRSGAQAAVTFLA
jgi:hypothetical protein